MFNENDLVTIETLAQKAKCTWRTAKKRLDAHRIRPVKSTRKSELYDFVSGMEAVVFGDDERTLEAHRHFTEGVAKWALPAMFGSEAPMMRYIVGMLREKGLTKPEALVEVGAILMMAMESMKQQMICTPTCEIDWIMDAAERYPDLQGLALFEKYCAEQWPDNDSPTTSLGGGKSGR